MVMAERKLSIRRSGPFTVNPVLLVNFHVARLYTDYSEIGSDVQQIIQISLAYCVLINISIPTTNFIIDSVG